MRENLFYAKLCMHVKITSVRSYEKLQCVETQTCKQILVMHAVVKLNLWMIEIPCVIIDVEMIYSVCDTDKRREEMHENDCLCVRHKIKI